MGLGYPGSDLACSYVHNGILVALEEVQFAVGPGYNCVNIVGKREAGPDNRISIGYFCERVALGRGVKYLAIPAPADVTLALVGSTAGQYE